MATKFYKCHVCGNIIYKLHDSNITPSCCNRPMTELPTNIVGEKAEFHEPCVTRIDSSSVKVVIGRTHHPMMPEHFIQFIVLETTTGIQVHHLKPYNQPEAIFFTSDTPIAIYAYCNLHGLWKSDVPPISSQH